MMSLTASLDQKTRITAADLPHILDYYKDNIKVLSLDCFDTLLWRKTATPREVFYVMQQRPLFQSLGVTAYQRINAAARAYRQQFITHGNHQIKMQDIYRIFTSLTSDQQAALAEDELATEMEMCYAFPAMVELIKNAHARGLKIIIVSDIYYTAEQLRRLLSHCLPNDVMTMIDSIFSSCEAGRAKSDGLFDLVQKELNQPASAFLHLGDHPIADFEAPRRHGLHALHFIQFHPSVIDFLRIQHTASALTALSNPDIHMKRAPRYSPFRGLLSANLTIVDKPETSVGYLSFGPIMFAFARFVTEEVAALRQAGKRVKVFFLLRDAYLLYRACEAYTGEAPGKLVRIRKFVSVAAAFRTQADVDHYLSSIAPQHFNMMVICEQLLLPQEIREKLIQIAMTSAQAEQTFYQLLHQPAILELIFQQSAAYRERLRRYIKKEMALEPGDTAVLVDTGYIGVTQEFLTRTFQDELNIEITGRYLMGSHEPDRPACKALITSSWCEHGLLEQSSTYKEGCVLDYDNEGDPIFDQIRLSDQQYAKVAALQTECLRFITDAKHYFANSHTQVPMPILRETAMAALKRHIFFPSAAEVGYFQSYQHDKDMGPTQSKTMYDVQQSISKLRQQTPPKLHPYEARTANLDLTLSTMLQRSFDLDFTHEDMSLQTEKIKVILLNGTEAKELTIQATKTHDGYYSLTTPFIHHEQIGIMFGEHYHRLQIENISLLGDNLPQNLSLDKNVIVNKMTGNGGNLFECLGQDSALMLMPLPSLAVKNAYRYQIIFRPIIAR